MAQNLYVEDGYVEEGWIQTGITIDYPNGIVFVPKATLVLTQSVPKEIYNHSMTQLHEILRAEEDTEDGRPFPIILEYDKGKTVGGVPLAPSLEISDYYVVEYEDGQYAVNLVGMNTNVADKTVVNQVSVRPQNSAGLTDVSVLSNAAYGGEVVYNETRGQAGVVNPIGTLKTPSNNWTDAMVIANDVNAKEINLQGVLTLGDGNNAEYRIIVGSHPLSSTLIVDNASDTIGLIAKNLTFSGDLDGGAILEHCVLGQVNYFAGFINDCALTNNTIFINGVAVMMACSAGQDAIHPPKVDLKNATSFSMWGYQGNIELVNCDADIQINITMDGELFIHQSCVAGTFDIYGDCKVNHTQTGTEIVKDSSTGSPLEIAQAVLDEIA